MLKYTSELFEMLDSPDVTGYQVADYLGTLGMTEVQVKQVGSEKGSTDFIKIFFPGRNGKRSGGAAPTIGIIGRLGGIGARPNLKGFVSDGDGCLAALTIAAKLAIMSRKGEALEGDVIVTTHICPDAPTREHFPVPFMDSPVNMEVMNREEVHPEMDAVISIDTTKGNKLVNHKGFAISNTVKDGYILKCSDDLLNLSSQVTGKLPVTFPLSQQDITPYGNDLYHINSIMQPCTATSAPVVGVAITTEVTVAGCATGATDLMDVEKAARFGLEIAKSFTEGKCSFYDAEEYQLLLNKYGSMERFKTFGSAA